MNGIPRYNGGPPPGLIHENYHFNFQNDNFRPTETYQQHPSYLEQQNWRWPSQNPFSYQTLPQSPWMTNGVLWSNGGDIPPFPPTETIQNTVNNHGFSNSQNNSSDRVVATGRNPGCPVPIPIGPYKKYLCFELEDSPHLLPNFKIDRTEIANFELNVDQRQFGLSVQEFTMTLKRWLRCSPSKEELMRTAKLAVLIVHKFGSKGLKPLSDVIGMAVGKSKRNKFHCRMIAIYLSYLIIGFERANYPSELSLPLCARIEYILSQCGLFRRIVTDASPFYKNQLYSLRWALRQYFSPQSLQAIDAGDFWRKHEVQKYPDHQAPHENRGGQMFQNVSNRFTNRLPQLPAHHYSQRSGDNNEKDLDKLGISLEAFGKDVFQLQYSTVIGNKNLIKVNWVIEFPLQEETKQRLTHKYWTTIPSNRLYAPYLYGKYVEFKIAHLYYSVVRLFLTAEKEKFIDIAKEAFFVESVFGNSQVCAVVSELLTARMAGRNDQNGEFHILSVHDRLIAVLVINIIICAEAVQSMCVYKSKVARPYSKAFSTDAFVAGFRDLVTTLKNKENIRRLYWMRQMWNACLIEDYLSKIDGNFFWWCKGIENTPLPAHFNVESRVEVPDVNEEEVAIIAEIDVRNSASIPRRNVGTVNVRRAPPVYEIDEDVRIEDPQTGPEIQIVP